MATDKKKAKRVATLFGKQKVTTTPEIAAKIKSGEIDPSTHSVKDGKFAPKRKAIVGGLGIVPAAGNLGITANKTGASAVPKSDKVAASAVPKANSTATKKEVDASLGDTQVSQNGKTKVAPAQAVASVPKTDKVTGQPITPAQSTQLAEQKAIKIAPVKQDLAALTEQLNTLHAGLDEAEDDAQINLIKKKIDSFKATLSAEAE